MDSVFYRKEESHLPKAFWDGCKMKSINLLRKKKSWKNWAATASSAFEALYTPKSTAELQDIVKKAARQHKRVRVIGASHSFSPVAMPEHIVLSLHHMRGLEKVDPTTNEAVILGGTYLHEIGPLLKEHGYALENMGDIQEQTIAGAVSTGTHGTGITFGSLSNQVAAWEWIDGNGNLHYHRRTGKNDDLANALHVSMGLLGILVRLTIKVVPLYSLKVTTFRTTIADAMSSWKIDMQTNRHLEWFYFPGTDIVQIKQMEKVAPIAQRKEEKINASFSKICIENHVFYLLSEWCRRNPKRSQLVSNISAKTIPNRIETGYSYEMFASPRKVKFYETEYAIPIKNFLPCIEMIASYLQKQPFSVHFPIECRFVKGEDGFLSPNYQQDSAFLAFHMYKGMEYLSYFAWVEELMSDFQGRPHWGKMNTFNYEQAKQWYPMWEVFLSTRQQFDPNGIFLNAYFEKLLSSSS